MADKEYNKKMMIIGIITLLIALIGLPIAILQLNNPPKIIHDDDIIDNKGGNIGNVIINEQSSIPDRHLEDVKNEISPLLKNLENKKAIITYVSGSEPENLASEVYEYLSSQGIKTEIGHSLMYRTGFKTIINENGELYILIGAQE